VTWPSAYACAPGLAAAAVPYALRPLRWDDREPIRQWRNDQIEVLRQDRPLSADEQDHYYLDVIAPQMAAERPPQILVAMTHDDALIGYGGIVHLSWPDRRGEVSFLTDTTRLDEATFTADWRAFLDLLLPVARDVLDLHKLTTETYEVRTTLIPILEQHGFVLEGTLREHHLLDGRWVTSLAHGIILSD
jgi:RimJ/RimL family protein N-acetyltransferase